MSLLAAKIHGRRTVPLRQSPLLLSPRPGETLDAICGGRVQLLQRASGYRFNLDPILLAHFAMRVAGRQRGAVMDLGTGSAVIPLILVCKFGLRNVTGLEVQRGLYELAQRNVQLNRCERRVSLVQGDLRRVEEAFQPGSFAQVLCNPPYRARHSGHASPEEEKAIARHEVLCGLEDVARAAAHLLKPGGSLNLVFPTARLCELLDALRRRGLEPKRLRMVHPHPDRGAKLLLVQAVKGGRPHVEALAPLVVHKRPKGFSAEVEEMLEDGSPEMECGARAGGPGPAGPEPHAALEPLGSA